jgi:hypothetical protein
VGAIAIQVGMPNFPIWLSQGSAGSIPVRGTLLIIKELRLFAIPYFFAQKSAEHLILHYALLKTATVKVLNVHLQYVFNCQTHSLML